MELNGRFQISLLAFVFDLGGFWGLGAPWQQVVGLRAAVSAS